MLLIFSIAVASVRSLGVDDGSLRFRLGGRSRRGSRLGLRLGSRSGGRLGFRLGSRSGGRLYDLIDGGNGGLWRIVIVVGGRIYLYLDSAVLLLVYLNIVILFDLINEAVKIGDLLKGGGKAA